MRAMVLTEIKQPLVMQEVPCPAPGPFDVLIKVGACGVCRTDLHIADGELPYPKLPLILGHQIVGTVEEIGLNVTKHQVGDRVGVSWLGNSCHQCEFCLSNRENLCNHAQFTGYSHNGGYAEFCVAKEDYTLALPHEYDDLHTAPLLCAGLIGFRGLRLAGTAPKIGFYGFGSSAHLLIQIANSLGQEVYVFTRPNDSASQSFAKKLGAHWVGGSDEFPPIALDAALIFAPAGELYPQALKAIKKGGKVISLGIHMSNIPSFPYNLLWEERSMSSVANLTRQDAFDYLQIIKKIPLEINVHPYSLEEANQALDAIRQGKIKGSTVLKIFN
ncbi:MAG: zinc-dependent alcohol dehydrogenase family protein [Parachlamydiaceae bacterium]